LILAIALPGATRNLTRRTAPGEKGVAAIVGQPNLPKEPVPGLAHEYPVAQCRSTDNTVNFLSTPTEAAREAQKKSKLTFLLHISGNFEDSSFT
jgi:hypothetical protein